MTAEAGTLNLVCAVRKHENKHEHEHKHEPWSGIIYDIILTLLANGGGGRGGIATLSGFNEHGGLVYTPPRHVWGNTVRPVVSVSQHVAVLSRRKTRGRKLTVNTGHRTQDTGKTGSSKCGCKQPDGWKRAKLCRGRADCKRWVCICYKVSTWTLPPTKCAAITRS